MTTHELRLDTGFPVAATRAGSRPLDIDPWLRWAADRLAAVRRIQQRRRAIGELARMSDSRLQDLGIPRDQIAEVVDGLIAREGPAMGRRAD
jgi:uncharacterized protein YjiS (DUF1127 family)